MNLSYSYRCFLMLNDWLHNCESKLTFPLIKYDEPLFIRRIVVFSH